MSSLHTPLPAEVRGERGDHNQRVQYLIWPILPELQRMARQTCESVAVDAAGPKPLSDMLCFMLSVLSTVI